MLSTEQLSTLKQQLYIMLRENKEAIHTHELLAESEKDTSGELSSYDNHPADLGTELFDREKDTALVVQYKQNISDAINALEAMENGSYGTCKTCGNDILFERLEAIPTTLYCKEHSKKQEIPTDRPVEEKDRYIPQVGKYDLYELVGYDAEDAWQDVARYGTSETQSDMGVHEEYDYNHMYLHSAEAVGYAEEVEADIATDITGRNQRVLEDNKNISGSEA